MSDSIGLAGTIGPWSAVFLALVALAGVLPAYLLYEKSRTEKAQALARVDDPGQAFVSHGIRAFGVRLNRSVKVPDLSRPPNLRALNAPDLKELGPRRDWQSALGSSDSRGFSAARYLV